MYWSKLYNDCKVKGGLECKIRVGKWQGLSGEQGEAHKTESQNNINNNTVHDIVKVSSHKTLNMVTILLQWSMGSMESEDSDGTWRVAGLEVALETGDI